MVLVSPDVLPSQDQQATKAASNKLAELRLSPVHGIRLVGNLDDAVISESISSVLPRCTMPMRSPETGPDAASVARGRGKQSTRERAWVNRPRGKHHESKISLGDCHSLGEEQQQSQSINWSGRQSDSYVCCQAS